MGDIDFDELDKAVNSLMGSGSVSKPADKSPASPPSTQRRSPSITQFARSRSQGVGAPNANQSQKSKAPATKRSGRFMDVVDSSSDLNPIRKPITRPLRDITRKSSALAAPLVGSTSRPVRTEAAPATTSLPTSTPPATPAPTNMPSPDPIKTRDSTNESTGEAVAVTFGSKAQAFPDPIDLMQAAALEEESKDESRPVAIFGQTPAPVEPSVDIQPVEPTIEPDPTPNNQFFVPIGVKFAAENEANEPTQPQVVPDTEVKEEDKAVREDIVDASSEEAKAPESTAESDSPFLTNAKVEKRPLNAEPLAAAEPEALLQSIDELMKTAELSSDELNNNAVKDVTTQIETYEPVNVAEVPELSNELVTIEATGRAATSRDESAPLVATTAAPVEPVAPQPPVEEPAAAPVGPVSIPQQYQAQESSGDVSHAPIYDANELAVPVAHPAKKKSGWLLVLAILILLAIGSGGAVALYLTGIIP